MRRSIILTITVFGLATASPVFSADIGTYRPGQAYSSTPVVNADLCESQCQGDAQCRAWNFVKVSPRQTSGVCEMNANDTPPIPSPVSISGTTQIASDNARSKLISGGTRTVRVGQSASRPASRPFTPQSQNFGNQRRQLQRPKIQPQHAQRPQNRRIIRESIPEQIRPRQSAYKAPSQSLTDQQNAQRGKLGRPSAPQHIQPRNQFQRFKHNLDATPRSFARPNVTLPPAPKSHRQTTPYAAPPQNHHAYPQYGAQHASTDPRLLALQKQQRAQSHAQQQAQYNPQHRPPLTRPGPHAYAQPQRPQPNGTPHAQLGQAPAPKPPMVKLPAARAQDSLFGSLYDDVIAPKPISADQITQQPNAPIATVTSVPTKPVQTETLSGLAGGIPQR